MTGAVVGDRYSIDALLTGKARAFGPKGEMSAMAKSPVSGRHRVSLLGIAGDEQGDLSVHGGPDKAIHHYPRDHYPFWTAALDGHALLERAGAFGENISTRGLVEAEACIGDRCRLGSALIEISQGRQPCWKLGHRFGMAHVPAMVVKTGRCGWYYRVIEEGDVAAGDQLELLDRPFRQWSVARVFALLIGGAGKRDVAAVGELAQLAPSLKTGARGRKNCSRPNPHPAVPAQLAGPDHSPSPRPPWH